MGNTKKKNPFLRFVLVLGTIILTLLVVVALILAFCAIDRKSSLSCVPRNYSIYVRTDSAFDTVNPLFDLEAADMLLASPEMSSLRKPFMEFRSSPLRENALVKFVASRPIDFALYGNGQKIGRDAHFVAVVNLGMFSLASRVGSFMYPKLNLAVENLSYLTDEQTSYFAYDVKNNGENLRIYIKSVKNLIVASDSLEHLLTASFADNASTYTKEQLALFKGKEKGELRIVADASALMHFVTEGNPVLSSMSSLISSESLSVISFNITDSDVLVNCRVPVNTSEGKTSLSELLSKKSTVPSLLTRFSDITQYYTILNAGSLEELKNAVLPFMPDVKDPQKFWKDCDDWSKTILSMGLDEFLFSWMGSEFAVFGIENQNDPVFAIQIKDEKKRQEVFNKLVSSILIKDDNSLILGGVRLSCLQFPSFLNWMLSLVGIKLPSPYFMVQDGIIYFSESPECLSAVYTNSFEGKPLVKNKNYLAVADGQKNETSLSLFYNLERSSPFFLRSNDSLSRVLQLYTMGRFDVRLEKDILELSLHACARKSGSLYSVEGFPMKLDRQPSSGELCLDSGKNPKNLYWVENRRTIKALNLAGMEILSKSETDNISIVACEKSKNGGTLWSVTSHGCVSLLNPSLECVQNFPLMLGETVSSKPCSLGENLVLASESGKVLIVKPDASLVTIELPELSSKSEVVSLEGSNVFAVYSKGFLGKIYYFEGEKCLNADNPFEVPGIALGGPALLKKSGKTYIGFVTQAGEMNLWRSDSADGEQVEGFPVRLGGVFMTNAVASEKYFYVMSNDAILRRVSLDGSVLNVQIPDATAKEGFISVRDIHRNGKKSVFVCADANVIYGFNENLELLSGYPLTGWGKPVFADVNGDKTSECLALTIDKKLVAWKTR